MASWEDVKSDLNKVFSEITSVKEDLTKSIKDRDEALDQKWTDVQERLQKQDEMAQKYEGLEERYEELKSSLEEIEAEGQRPGQTHDAKSLGRTISESNVYEEQKARSWSGKSAPVKLDGIVPNRKALTTGTGAGYGQMGQLIQPQEQGVLAPLQLPLMLRDLFPVIRLTNSDSVTFVEVLDHANVYTELSAAKAGAASTITVKSTAGLFVGQEIELGVAATPTTKVKASITSINTTTRVVGIANVTGGGDAVAAVRAIDDPVTAVAIGMTPHGMQKPEANLLGVTEKSYTIGTMAHYMVAHRQTLQDIPQLEGIINNALVFGLKQSEEVQLLYGNGTAPNLTGIMNNANIQNHGSFGTTAQANANAAWRFDHIRRALAKLQMVGGAAGGVMVHPMDWLEFELSKDTTARYIYATINQGAQQELLWRTPVVVSQAVRQGDFLVGDFNNGAYILDREDANVRFSDQHADFFTSNMIAILAEERIGLAVPRPQFFVKGNFTLS